VVGFTTGSRGEVPGKKEILWQEMIVIIIIIVATRIVSKSLQKYLETIPGQHSVDPLQKNCHTRNITHHKESATS
jgi:hypothetical protein